MVPRIKKEFLAGHPIFELEEWGNGLHKDYFHYTMVAHYESHDGGKLFNRLNKNQQKNYFRRAETRREHILRGWADFDGIIISYLKDRFGPDYEKLPFRQS